MTNTLKRMLPAFLPGLLCCGFLSAQTCLKGDCKGGEGVMRVDKGSSRVYQVGRFNRKGQLNGEGLELEWGWGSTNQEADFLFALAQGLPSLEELWNLRPAYIRKGAFKEGKLQGTGILMINNARYFPMAGWLSDRYLPGVTLNYVRYDGQFVNSDPQPSGVVTMMGPRDTLICASDQLMPPEWTKNYADPIYEAEMVIDIRHSNGLKSELIRGTFLNRKLHGWAIVHRKSASNPAGTFYRQLWCYNRLLYEDYGGVYPFDMDNPQTLTLSGVAKITGPLKDGKVNGFGTIDWGYNMKYTGYLKDNLPHGYGQWDSSRQKYGLFNEGKFVQGSWLYSDFNRLIVEEGRTDGFTAGNIKRSLYRNLAAYLQGEQPVEGWEGYFVEGTGWQGLVKSFDMYARNETMYDKGKIVSSNAAIARLWGGQVYVKDGRASLMVKYDPVSQTGTLADGRIINRDNMNEYKPSKKYYETNFYSSCSCDGQGTTTTTAEVSGYTRSWTRTEQVNKSAVVGYWQGTQQVTSTYYTPGYTITRKVPCSNPRAEWVRYGVGTRHMVRNDVTWLPE